MSVQTAETTDRAGRDAQDRRASGIERVPFEALVAIAQPSGGGFEAESVDVSADGMRLRTAYLPEVGANVVCRFDVDGKELSAQGEVTWCNEEAKGGEFGLRFVMGDAETADAVSALCKALADDSPEASAAPSSVVPAGARVRLHIDGLGSPMKARVRESAKKELAVGSNLEFLKVGRSIELEDVEHGKRREAHIAQVKVDVDPGTNVPQLVVTLNYGKQKDTDRPEADAGAPAKAASTSSSKTAEAAAPPRVSQRPEGRVATMKEAGAGITDDASGAGLGARMASASRVFADRVAPTFSSAGVRARDAMASVLELIKRRRNDQKKKKKSEER